MSYATSLRSAPTRAAGESASQARPLEVVHAVPRTNNAWFAALCLGVVMAGFVLVLLLNTAMAQGSYELRNLQSRSDELNDSRDALAASIEAVSGPGPLARRAAGMGMVPATGSGYISLAKGKVTQKAPQVKKPGKAKGRSGP